MRNRKQQITNIAEARPDSGVIPTAKRRSFSKAEKLRILAAAGAGCARRHWRREGNYSWHLATTWRKQRQLAGEA